MIIDTLRSTQSALNMNDENSGTLQVGEAQAPGCNGKASYVVQKAMQTGVPDGNRLQKQKMEAMKVEPQSQDSDSDDSVDRGIEEAIQEYLKEKGDHKQIKEKEESSSDDGIEEAIWHFQLEKKKKHQDSRNPSKVFQAKEESDSSSDDGIEEAIRHYQLEKQKEKSENTIPEGSVTNAPEMEEDSSSVDSDDSIEQEIRKFLAEKARESSVRTDFEEIRDNGVNTTDIVAKRTGVFEAQQAEVSSNTSTRYSDLLPSDESQPRCQEGDHLQSSSTDLYVPKINKSHQADGPRDANQCHSDQNACITPGSVTNSKLINQTTPRRETEVSYLQGQNLLPCSPFSPPREWEVGMTGKSDLHRVADRHQTKSVLPTDDVSPTMGDSATASRHKLSNPCAHSPEMALTASPPNPKFISAQLPDKHHKNQPAKDSCQGQPAASTMSENAVHERDSIKTSHIQVKNGNRSRGEDGTCVMGEMISRRIEEGLQVREGWEERADETDFESEERTSGSQQSEQRSQHPRL
ncbi:protein phosphatase 1 regulatory subunit 26-like [Arapaima gigas]